MSTCRSAARPPACTTLTPPRLLARMRGLHVDPATVRAPRRQGTRSPPPRRRSACPCPTRTAITDPQQVDDVRIRHPSAPIHPQEHRVQPGRPTGPDAAVGGPRRAATPPSPASLPISADDPWILQEFVAGQEYCTHSTVRDGARAGATAAVSRRRSSSTTRWSTSREIEAWVRRFVEALRLTGQVSFDFISSDDGTLYAIECNPRTHSAITMFYDHPDVAPAYLDDGAPEIRPTAASRPTYWLYHELWRLMTQPGAAATAGRSRGARTRSSTGRTRCRS